MGFTAGEEGQGGYHSCWAAELETGRGVDRGGGEMAAVSLVLPYSSGLRSSMGWALLQREVKRTVVRILHGISGSKGKKPSCRHSSAEVGCWAWRNGGRGEGLHLSLFIFSWRTGWCVQGVSCLWSLDWNKATGVY